MNYCDCELRNRQWDPNTRRCRTCGLAYVEPFPGSQLPATKEEADIVLANLATLKAEKHERHECCEFCQAAVKVRDEEIAKLKRELCYYRGLNG